MAVSRWDDIHKGMGRWVKQRVGSAWDDIAPPAPPDAGLSRKFDVVQGPGCLRVEPGMERCVRVHTHQVACQKATGKHTHHGSSGPTAAGAGSVLAHPCPCSTHPELPAHLFFHLMCHSLRTAPPAAAAASDPLLPEAPAAALLLPATAALPAPAVLASGRLMGTFLRLSTSCTPYCSSTSSRAAVHSGQYQSPLGTALKGGVQQ